MGGGHPHLVEVNHQQPRVAVAGDKRQPVGRVDQQAVVVVAASKPDPAHDLLAARVDHRELVAALHRHQHLPAARVEGDVAGVTAKLDRAAPLPSCRVDNDLRAARLVADNSLRVAGS